MPFYSKIKVSESDSPEVSLAKKRTAARLVALKEALDKTVPRRHVDGDLLLATWNIREFGEGDFRGWTGEKVRPGATAGADEEAGMKGRFMESIYYLAEIVDRFDLIALQEVRDDLEDLNYLRDILGSWWKILITDVTAGRQGNRERVAFLYDERKVKFGGLAGEVVLPPEDGKPAFQLARTPYLVGFRAGWFTFTICSTHLYYGEDKADDPQRLKEMDLLAEFLAKEVTTRTAWAKNSILLGDFNIFNTTDEQFKVLTKKHKFVVPQKLSGSKTNTGGNKPFDQIAFVAPAVNDQLATADSGVFPFFDHVFTDADEQTYRPAMGDRYVKTSNGKIRTAKEATNYYRQWRSFQMSDHNPLWVSLKTDFGLPYLKSISR